MPNAAATASSTRSRLPILFIPSDSLGDLSSHLEELLVYGLPDAYFNEYVGNIQRVTAAAVQQAATTYIDPARMAVVVVGDRKVIEPGIRALKLAPVRVISLADVFGS